MDPKPRRRFPHGLGFLIALTLFGGGVGAAYASPPGRSLAADRVRAAVELLLAKARTAGERIPELLPEGGEAAAPPSPSPAPPSPAPAVEAPDSPLRTVVRVVDGDTLELDGKEKVRLTGINTPESVDPRRAVQWYGKEAAKRAREMVEGRRVRLEFDVERKDRYGRTLAYVHREDGLFVNLALVEEGYAFAYRYPPNVRHAERFREAERGAREGARGLWSDAAKAAEIAPKRR
ncbi:MAG: thermonuclease family protein [Planctomycetaceae bacterium]|nr:thermonuclease family protein [Planctomycetaceae bacterium]